MQEGVNARCPCVAGGEWRTDRADEGCHQAQSYADVRGEESDCLPVLVYSIQSTILAKDTSLCSQTSLSSQLFSQL